MQIIASPYQRICRPNLPPDNDTDGYSFIFKYVIRYVLCLSGGTDYSLHACVRDLSHLAPDIAAAILDGRQPTHLNRQFLARIDNLPIDWASRLRRASEPPSLLCVRHLADAFQLGLTAIKPFGAWARGHNAQ